MCDSVQQKLDHTTAGAALAEPTNPFPIHNGFKTVIKSHFELSDYGFTRFIYLLFYFFVKR